MDFSKIAKTIKQYETQGMSGQLPATWASAIGSKINLIDGKELIDFTSGIFVTNIGHGNEGVLIGLNSLLNPKSPLLYCYNYHSEYRAKYLAKLIEFCQPYFQKAHLMSSGTESTEAALRIMLLNAQNIYPEKNVVVSISGNFHGRTMGAALMSGDPLLCELYPDLSKRFKKLPFPDPSLVDEGNGAEFFRASIAALEEGLGGPSKLKIAGFMVETFQGWAAYFYPKSFISALCEYAKENEALVCFDEMQSGFGRTGKKFGFEHYEVHPDLICVGKGMGSGVAISGVLSRGSLLDLPTPGSLSSTNSANPIACMAGLKTIEAIEELDLISRARELGDYFHECLGLIEKKSKYLNKVHGKGMIAALHFGDSGDRNDTINRVNELVFRLLRNGLLTVRTGRETVKLGPPLSISQSDLDKGLFLLEEAILGLEKPNGI